MSLRSRLLVVALPALVVACATVMPPLEQRTTQGPAAEEMYILRMVLTNGREPTFDERQQWERHLDEDIARYLREHPEAANSLDVSIFRFQRRVTVGMSKEQVLILLGAPAALTMDAGEMEKLARGFWAALQGNVTEAWAYPLGWRLFFAGPRLVDITQYLEH